MKRNRLFTLSILSGLLLALPWLEWFSGIILFIALIPLFFVEDYLFRSRDKNKKIVGWGYAFLTFLIWNIIATGWLYKVSFPGALIVIVGNAFLLSLVFWLFHIVKRNMGEQFGNFSLLVFWLAWEYLYMNTEISWPWLNLGNGFAKDINLIQWYEYTGILGGTFWILAVNLLLFQVLRNYVVHRNIKGRVKQLVFLGVVVIAPIIFSVVRFNQYKEKGEEVRIGIIQPNVDPYKEKFSQISQDAQLGRIAKLSFKIADQELDYLVGPETALIDSFYINQLEENRQIELLKAFPRLYPDLHYVIGIEAKRKVDKKKEPIVYNSAIQIDSTDQIQIYHKSKLVPGVEMMPYSEFFGFLDHLMLNIGGAPGTHGKQLDSEVFEGNQGVKVAPVICYESVYGEYVSRYVNKGAELIFIMTNDGWWGGTQGYKQHLNYASLRSIETRRAVARSANTGISCFINQKGQILKSTDWGKQAAIKGILQANTQKTFYVKYGNYIGRIASFLGIFALLYLLVGVLMTKKEK